jgi:hypothetical protein
MTYTDNRAIDGTLNRRPTAYGAAHANVSEASLRGFDTVGGILALIMLLGPLAAGAIGIH